MAMIIRRQKVSPVLEVMEVLWLAIILYSAGLAVVLHFRPALMFNEDGTWKEFGYQRSPRHTLLPFWLFVVAWAFVSYAVSAAIVWLFMSRKYDLTSSVSSSSFPSSSFAAPTAAAAATMSYSDYEDEDDDDDEEEQSEMTPASSMTPLTSSDSIIMPPPKRGPGRPRKVRAQPGYYVREDAPSEAGLHRYIYYGPDAPPTDGQVAAIRLPNATP